MTDTPAGRIDELRDEARRLRIDDSDIETLETRDTIGAYADLLNLNPFLVYDLELSLAEIRQAGSTV